MHRPQRDDAAALRELGDRVRRLERGPVSVGCWALRCDSDDNLIAIHRPTGRKTIIARPDDLG